MIRDWTPEDGRREFYADRGTVPPRRCCLHENAHMDLSGCLTQAFTDAATDAMQRHFDQGLSVHGMVDGKWCEIKAPDPPHNID